MLGYNRNIKNIQMVALFLIVATFVVSCTNKIKKIDKGELENVPSQTVENMAIVQSKDGRMEFRMTSPIMNKYDQEGGGYYEHFPDGIKAYGYNSDGLLETEIVSNEAKHESNGDKEVWSAYGDVVINNFIKGERIETDTLYWDRENKKIHTDCYVKLTSPNGLMQGFGMISDEMARDAVLLKPFDSYGIVVSDSTKINYIDSVNFIGPLYRR